MTATQRRWLIAAIVAATLVGLAFAAYRLALNELRAQVLQALGPDARIGEIDLSFRAIHLNSLTLKAPAGWPAKHTLSADAVVIVPDLASLFTNTIVISSIKIERANFSLLRDRDGKMRVLPSLTERKPSAGGKSAGTAESSTAARVNIGEIVLKNATVSFFDNQVRTPALEIRLENVDARLKHLGVPGLADKSELTLTAKMIGPTHHGTLSVNGWMVLATRDSDIKAVVRGVDVVSLEPYLIQKAETGVRKGMLDLDLDSKISAQRIRAPGVLKLKDLELRSDGGGGTFMGMPRDSVVGMLRDRDGTITIPFTIEGSINEPGFALDRAFKARVGLAAAATLGLTIKDLIDVFGNRRDKSGESESKAGQVIDALKGLFRK